MSYASVASQNAPPPSEQPHADPSLLTTETTPPPPTVDDTLKVNLVPTDFKQHPSTVTSQIGDQLRAPDEATRPMSRKKSSDSRGARKTWFERVFGMPVFTSSVAGGLLAVANITLLGTVGYFAYITREYRGKFLKYPEDAMAG
ncbi:hypothetical protein EWM64_g7971 [Hericium alpestre]|uniref:Uncharacterized protein n=1 Tax=Hericium alpestre TaxID=135208 RepID=A0A4Y9ZRA8_9AGAM|nr:hypothetical protein EWM64_g7971 [Hericium alpestre]